MTNKHLGNIGEDYALLYLQGQGYQILHRNWRAGHCEIDIVAKDQEITVFVEVKTRKTTQYGFPEESISTQKMNRLTRAAEQYLHQFPATKIRFDVIAILLDHGAVNDFLHIRDAIG